MLRVRRRINGHGQLPTFPGIPLCNRASESLDAGLLPARGFRPGASAARADPRRRTSVTLPVSEDSSPEGTFW
jgi:hypothetical protein